MFLLHVPGVEPLQNLRKIEFFGDEVLSGDVGDNTRFGTLKVLAITMIYLKIEYFYRMRISVLSP